MITQDELDDLPVGTPKKGRKKVWHLLLFRDHLAKIRKNGYIDWEDITQEMFREYQSTILPLFLRGGATKSSGDDTDDNVTNKQLENFEHAIKIITDHYPKFNSQVEHWLPFKRKFISVAKSHNMEAVLDNLADETFTPPDEGSHARILWDKQNDFLFSAMNQQITGSRSILILRKHEANSDARKAFIELMWVYESTANKQAIAQK